MLFFCACVAAIAALPEVGVTWKGDAAELSVVAPEGFELSPEAPADIEVRWSDRQVSYAVSGAQITAGVDLWAIRGQAVEGDLTVTVCDKSDGLCVPMRLAIWGDIPSAKKGAADLLVTASDTPAAEPNPGPKFNTDAQALADAAFEAVKGTKKKVLLDFSAVWCPPCNQLAAEVLHANEPPAILQQYEVVVLDADDRRSWAYKDRYHVGGYPTVIVADAKGNEISRVVGYPGSDEFVQWLEVSAGQSEPATDWATVDPTSKSSEEAGKIAWVLAERREDGVEPWIARAEEGEPTLELRLARALTAPSLEDARWLADQAPSRALDWIPAAAVLSKEEGGRAVLQGAIQRALVGAVGEEASDLLYFSAVIADDEQSPLLYAASASALRASFTGDALRDRAFYTSLAGLLEKSGDVEGAVSFLRDAQQVWPAEPTFLLTEAGIHARANAWEQSLLAAEGCMAAAWGDNKLRCAEKVCRALVSLDRVDEARSRARAILDEIEPPAASLDVRAPRYRKALQAYVEIP